LSIIVTLATGFNPIDLRECGKTKGCFRLVLFIILMYRSLRYENSV